MLPPDPATLAWIVMLAVAGLTVLCILHATATGVRNELHIHDTRVEVNKRRREFTLQLAKLHNIDCEGMGGPASPAGAEGVEAAAEIAGAAGSSPDASGSSEASQSSGAPELRAA